MSSEPHSSPDPVPADLAEDLALARGSRVHTRVLAGGVGIAVGLGLIAVAAQLMAGSHGGDPIIAAGLSLLAVGQCGGLASAVIGGIGLIRMLRPADQPQVLARVTTERTSARLGMLMRVLGAALVLAVAAWALLRIEGIVGAIVGAVVSAQSLFVLAFLRSRADLSRGPMRLRPPGA